MQTPQRFAEALDHLSWEPVIAVDTEADAFFSYREKVCLIQFATREREFLVDPLAGLPLRDLAPIFANPLQTKIFHDAEFDVMILKRDFGFTFRSIFDTRLACSLLGSERPGLANVLEERFGVKLDKSHQRSNWCERPLSLEQLCYAREDTAYLIRLYEEVSREIDARGRRRVHAAECRRLEGLEPRSRAFDPAGWTKISGAKQLDPRRRRVLHELFAWREEVAKQADTAPFRIAPNELLVALARQADPARGAEQAADRLKGRLRQEYGSELLEVFRRAFVEPPFERMPERHSERSGPGRWNDRQQALYDALREWRKNKAAELEMDAAYILPRRSMESLALEPVEDGEALRRVPEIDLWRVESFAEELLALLRRFEAPRSAAGGEGGAPVKKARKRTARRKKVGAARKAT